MKFLLLSFIAFSSVFAQSSSGVPITSTDKNDTDNDVQVEEVFIDGMDANALKNILLKYDANGNELDHKFQSLFSDYVKTQTKFDEQLVSLVKNDGFNDVLFNRLMPIVKEVFKFIWNYFLMIFDYIWSTANHMFEQTFNRSLPITYYMSAKIMSKQFGSYLCQKATITLFSISADKAVHHCSSIFTPLKI